MPGYNCTIVPGVKPNICCAGGSGTLLGGTMGLGRVPEGIIYLLLLLWTFFGVAIVADIFMTAIEQVTSQTYTVKQIIDGTTRRFRVKVWNDTVANLTLMALGSSAPEILLSVIELFSGQMYSGELGPSTIVGSAAFNLLMILAICVVAVPEPQLRRIDSLGVYTCTCLLYTSDAADE